jgi:hypothetical protein
VTDAGLETRLERVAGGNVFDALYSVVGLTGGATVFNVFLIGQIVPCVVGVIPYLMLRRSRPQPDSPVT